MTLIVSDDGPVRIIVIDRPQRRSEPPRDLAGGGPLVGGGQQDTGACLELATRYHNIAGTIGVARDNH